MSEQLLTEIRDSLRSILGLMQEQRDEQLKMRASFPVGVSFVPPGMPTLEEQLIQLVKRRDFIEQGIETVKSAVGKIRERGRRESQDGSSFLEAQLVMSGLPDQLEAIERQISDLQKRIEESGDVIE